MSNEITISAALSYDKAGIDIVARSNPTAAGDTLTQKTAEIRYTNRVQNIGNAPEAIGLGDVGDPGWFWARNIGGGPDIYLMNGAGGDLTVKLEEGEWCLFRWNDAATPYATAGVGGADMEYLFLED